MRKYDAVVIGGGLLGCFAARELCRYDISVLLIEKREDVCTGISKANSAIIYPGYDHKPGTLKQSVTLRANSGFDRLCSELDVPFSRCGSLMVSYSENADAVLRKKYENGLSAGVPGLRLISGAEACEIEPALAEGISMALFAPSAGTVDPWILCCSAFENALSNGCDCFFNTELTAIKKDGSSYILETTAGDIQAGAVINCAGLNADAVHEMLFTPKVRIRPEGADYMILERGSAKLQHIIQHEHKNGKGITAVPTVGGSILLGPTEREIEDELSSVSSEGLEWIDTLREEYLPGLSSGKLIRSFAATRPIVYSVKYENGKIIPDGKSIGSFAIEYPEPGFISFIGIKTPGLTCSPVLGAMAAERTASYLCAARRPDFSPEHKGITRVRDLSAAKREELVKADPDYGDILCLCEQISKAEILEAIQRGAVSIDGVKHRCGAMLGICQGSRCQYKIAELISKERGIPIETVMLSGEGSYIFGDAHG